MKAYSLDLREKIVRAVDERVGSQGLVAQLFGVSRSFVEKLLRRRRRSGSVAPLPHAGGQGRKLRDTGVVLRRAVARQPDVLLGELCERVAAKPGVRVSVATMCRELQRLGLPRKKRHSTLPNGTPCASKPPVRSIERR